MTGRPAGRRGRLPGSLRFRVTALAALAVLGVLTSVGVGVTLAHRAVLTDSLDESLGDQADAIAARVRAGEPVQRRDLPRDDVVAQVVDSDGTVLAESPGLAGIRLGTETPAGTTVRGGVLPDGGAARVLVTPVGGETVYVAGTLEDVDDSVGALRRSLLAAVPVSTAVLAGLIWWLVGRVLRPVDAIRLEVDRISASRLDRRVPEPPTTDEIARLARTMNAMLDRLDASAVRQRRFVADAAHELRSPLARVRAELEVDAAHPASADLQATHASVLTQAVTLQRLVDDLLLLARGDSGALRRGSAGPVDLDDVVQRVVGARRDPRVAVRDVVPVQVAGDAEQLERALRNLLDNAVRHARDRIEVSLAALGGTAELTVTDDGPGIPAADADRVFERFTRLDDARTDGGAGLGLAIARDIAERHGGSLTLDGRGEGATFILRLPVAPEGDR
ncbi:MAG: sensor histidine kinase [Blastococcus sp.]|nr:sensor histidine kinase [Blastococcus sp.]